MKIYDIIHKFTNDKLTFEIVENESLASFGFYKRNEVINSPYYEKYLKKINFQYIKGKRLVIFYI